MDIIIIKWLYYVINVKVLANLVFLIVFAMNVNPDTIWTHKINVTVVKVHVIFAHLHKFVHLVNMDIFWLEIPANNVLAHVLIVIIFQVVIVV